MKNYEAVGVIEAQYFTVALEILDQVCKTANVEYVTSEKYLGGKLVTLIIGGNYSDVNEAIDMVKQMFADRKNILKMCLVINNPHPEILKFILSPQQKQKQNNDIKEKNDQKPINDKPKRNRRRNKNE